MVGYMNVNLYFGISRRWWCVWIVGGNNYIFSEKLVFSILYLHDFNDEFGATLFSSFLK